MFWSQWSCLAQRQARFLLLFNSCLVCHLVLDQKFGSVVLAGCHLLSLSLEPYHDDLLPGAAGELVSCLYVNPLLFALTIEGIVCILTHHALHCDTLLLTSHHELQEVMYICMLEPDFITYSRPSIIRTPLSQECSDE